MKELLFHESWNFIGRWATLVQEIKVEVVLFADDRMGEAEEEVQLE